MKISELPCNKHKRYFERAYEIALHGPGAGGKKNRFRLGSVLVYKKQILTAKYNCLKTSPKLRPFSRWPFLHSESNCILSHGLDNCEHTVLYVLRILRNGELAMARPCTSCNKLIKFVGVKKIYYTTFNGYEELVL